MLAGLVNSNDKPIVRHMFRNPVDKEATAVFTNLKALTAPSYFFHRLVQFIRNHNHVDELLEQHSFKPGEETKLHSNIKLVFFILNKFVADISNYLVDNKNRDLSCISSNIMHTKKQISDTRYLFVSIL